MRTTLEEVRCVCTYMCVPGEGRVATLSTALLVHIHSSENLSQLKYKCCFQGLRVV